jgi:glutaredoxin-like YruB-family protein
MKLIHSYMELKQFLENSQKSYLLLYKSGNETSDCAYRNFSDSLEGFKDIQLLFADVNKARDIHIEYAIHSVPSLLEFKKDKHVNTYKGCYNKDQLKGIFEHADTIIKAERNGSAQKTVIVYSTPACSWCNTLKGYLRKRHVLFTDIDVSRDERAAAEMIKRSGQQGVPQTMINGELIIGFDKQKIDRLLEIDI